MNVTDLARYRSRRDNRARELAMWQVFEGTYLSLCDQGVIDYDAKTLRRLWDDYARKAISAREMMSL